MGTIILNCYIGCQSKIEAMSAMSGLVNSVTTPGAAMLMASTVAAIIGPPPAGGSGQPSTLGIEVQSQAVEVTQVSV